MRPKTIVYFEWIIFGVLLLGVLYNYLSWDQIIGEALAEDATLDRNTALVIAIAAIIFNYVLVGTLTLLVSRGRSKIAMLVLIALSALVLSRFALGIVRSQLLLVSDIIPVLQCIGQVLAYGLLFTPSARRWMRREDEKEREAASSGARRHHFT